MNDELASQALPHLVSFGSCILHVVNNAFGNAINSFGHDAEEFAIDLFYLFKQSACKREDLVKIQSDFDASQHNFLRHVSSRWLTLESAVARINDQWEVIKQYILTLPSSNKSCESSSRYRSIRRNIEDETFIFTLHFITSVSPLFARFLTSFQSQGPLVHVLHISLVEMVKAILLHYMKSYICIKTFWANLQFIFNSLWSFSLIPVAELQCVWSGCVPCRWVKWVFFCLIRPPERIWALLIMIVPIV